MLRRAVTNLARNIGTGALASGAASSNAFHNSAAANSFFKNPFREQKIRYFVDFIGSSERPVSVPYQFRNPSKSILLEALSKSWIIDNSKLPYIANNIEASDIRDLTYSDKVKLILAILKEDEKLIRKYMESSTLEQKVAALNFFIDHYMFTDNYYAVFVDRVRDRLTIKGKAVLQLLSIVTNSKSLPELHQHSDLKKLLCAGVYSGHINNLPESTLLELLVHAVENNNSTFANKIATMVNLANLENSGIVLKKCLENNMDELAFKIGKASDLDQLSTVVEFAVGWRNAAMMEHITRVFNPVRYKIDKALANIRSNSTSTSEVAFTELFISKAYVEETSRKHKVKSTEDDKKAKTNNEEDRRANDDMQMLQNVVLAHVLLDLLDSDVKHTTRMPNEDSAAKVEVPHKVVHDTFRDTGGMSRSRSDDDDNSRSSYDSRSDDHRGSSYGSGSSGSDD